MTKWAYKRLMIENPEITQPTFEAKLDELGAEGWELVALFDRERGGNTKDCCLVFKRART